MSEKADSSPGQADDDRLAPILPIPTVPEEVEHTAVLMASENVNNENLEKELQLNQENSLFATNDVNRNNDQSDRDQDETSQLVADVDSSDETYAKHTTYNDNGEAIYTDPSSSVKFKWNAESKSWEQCELEDSKSAYENEHYKWDAEKSEWVPKDKSNLETDSYKWDLETKQWIPKILTDDVTRGFEDGVHTYTDGEGVVYFWDTGKNEWCPKVDDFFLAKYQMSYGFVDNTTPHAIDDDTKEVLTISSATGGVPAATEDTEKTKKRKGGNKEPPSMIK